MAYSITVCVPTKNEAETVKEIIEQVRSYADEVIVVDGHSTDNTLEVCRKLGGVSILLDNGKGKGDAIRLAIREAKGDILVFIDADGSHDPLDIPRLLQPLLAGEVDMVVGSRMKGGSDELYGTLEEFIRLMGSQIITLAINYRFGVALTDSQNGFRAIKRDVALKLGLKEDLSTIEQEMTIKCLRHNYIVKEIPTHEYARKAGISKIVVWKVAHRYVWCLVKGLIGL